MSMFFPDPKDPADFVNYEISWEDWLEGEGIVSAEWDVPEPLEIGEDEYAPSFTTSVATVWIGGGVDGGKYPITCTIVTNGILPRTGERTVMLRVKDLF